MKKLLLNNNGKIRKNLFRVLFLLAVSSLNQFVFGADYFDYIDPSKNTTITYEPENGRFKIKFAFYFNPTGSAKDVSLEAPSRIEAKTNSITIKLMDLVGCSNCEYVNFSNSPSSTTDGYIKVNNSFRTSGQFSQYGIDDGTIAYAEFYYYPPERLLGQSVKFYFDFFIEQDEDGQGAFPRNHTSGATTLANISASDFTLSSDISSDFNKFTVSAKYKNTEIPPNLYWGKGTTAANASIPFNSQTKTIDVVRSNNGSQENFTIKLNYSEKLTKTITIPHTVPGYQNLGTGNKALSASYHSSGKVTLSWNLAPGTGDRIGGDDFIIQRADNANFTNAKEIARIAVVLDQANNFEYVDDLIANNINSKVIYYRITRSKALAANWDWSFGQNRSITPNYQHVEIKSVETELIIENSNAIKISWTYNNSDNIWTPGSAFVIMKYNVTTGNTDEIRGTLSQMQEGFYLDEAVNNCNAYEYNVYVLPGNESFHESFYTKKIKITSIFTTELSSLISVTASKGYYSNRVELDWKSKGSFDEFDIARKEYGDDESEWKTIQTVGGSSVSTSYFTIDETGSPGQLYDYRVIGLLNCAGDIVYSNEVVDHGFRTPTGDIYGRITFENGQAVDSVQVILETTNGIPGKSLLFNGSANARVSNTALLKTNTELLSIQAWISPDSVNAVSQSILSKADMYDVGISNNYFYFTVGNDTLSTDIPVSDYLSFSNFIHLTASFNKDFISIYINGKFAAGKEISTTISGNDNPVILGENYYGVIDEVRIWGSALSAEEISGDYNRYITGEESNLLAYWNFNHAVKNAFFDISYQGSKYNSNHGIINSGVELISTRIPSNEQLGYKGITGADGSYSIRAIPYMGNGTAYTIIPRKGIHSFEPQKEIRFISSGTQSHTVNYTDNSSFRVTGTVTYKGGTYPVNGVSFVIDGVTALQKNGMPILTDAAGEFEIQVPVGTHEVKAVKIGHSFENDGRICDSNNQDLNYQDEVLGRKLTDITTIKYIGRVAGGTEQEGYILGHSLSKNNLSDDIYVKLKHQKQGYKLASVENTIEQEHFKPSNATETKTNQVTYSEDYITITPNLETGEFVAYVIPESFVVEAYANGHNYIAQNSELNLTQKLTLQDIVYDYVDSILVNNKWEYTNYSDTVKFNVSQKFIKRYSPEIRIEQLSSSSSGDALLYYGNKTTKTTNILGETTEVPLYDEETKTYILGKPAFVQNEKYYFKTSLFEAYKYNGADDIIDEVPTSDAKVKFINDIAGEEATVEGDSDGVSYYTFKAGNPELTSATRSISATVTYGSDSNPTSIDWIQPFTNGNAIVLGMQRTGTDFVTAGPDKVLTILRDPPGSNSYSYLEKGVSFEESSVYTGSFKNEGSEQWTSGIKSAICTVNLVGGVVSSSGVTSTIAEAETGLTLGIIHEEEYTGSDTKTTKTVTTTRFQTSSESNYVGTDADVYIGYSTNITFGSTKDVTVVSKEQFINAGGESAYEAVYDDASSPDWVLVQKIGVSIAQSFKTLFAYPQIHIEERIIGETETLRNSLLLQLAECDTTVLRNNVQNDKEKVYYVSLVSIDDENYGKEGFYKWIFNKEKKAVTDTISYLNQSIDNWIKQMRMNDSIKVHAERLQNYSFQGGSEIEYSEEYSTTKSHESTFSVTIGGKIANDWMLGAGTEKTKFELEEQISSTQGGEWSSEVEYSHSKGFVLAEEGSDYISVDVCREPGWKKAQEEYEHSGLASEGMVGEGSFKAKDYYSSFIFKTQAGVTSCPYEGAYISKYYEPEKNHIINQATIQVEVPEISVERNFIENVPSGESAKFVLYLRNNSEAQWESWYTLKMVDDSNPDGAKMSIDGAAIANGCDFLVPAGETLIKTLEVAKGRALNYDDLKLVLVSQCQGDPADFSTIIADTVTFHVHFTPSCSNVSIIKPNNNWTYNTVLPTIEVNGVQEHYMAIEMGNFDVNYDDFSHIRLQYKSSSESDNDWVTLISYYNDSTSVDYLSAKENGENVSLIKTADAGKIYYNFFMDNKPDQLYDLRAVAICNINNEKIENPSEVVSGIKDMYNPRLFGSAKPANGILTIEDEIQLNFNEQIAEGFLTKNNFQITGIRNGAKTDHSVSIRFDGQNDYMATDANRNLAEKDITIEMWINADAQDATLFSHGNINEAMELSITANNHLKVILGNTVLVSEEAFAFDRGSWAHIALVYEAEGYISAYYNYTEMISRAPVSLYYGSGNFILGKSINDSNYFSGRMHNARIWNKVMSSGKLQLNSLSILSGNEPGLLGYYPMNEGKESLALDKARGANMTLYGCKWSMPEGYASDFDGTNSYIALNTSAAVVTEEMDYTIEFWFKAESGQTNSTILCNGLGTGAELAGSKNIFNIGFDSEGRLQFTNNGVSIQIDGTYDDNNWHHFAITANRTIGRAQIYLDGELNQFFDSANIGGIASDKMYVGACGWYDEGGAGVLKTDNFFLGKVDDIRFWNLYKGATLIEENINKRLDGTEMGLLAYYPFEHYIEWQGNKELQYTLSDQKTQKDPSRAVSDAVLYGNTAQTADIAPIKDKGPVANLEFEFVVNKDALIINLKETAEKIEKAIVTFTVSDVRDLNGNYILSPITWSAYIDRNQLKWMDDEINLSKNVYEPLEFAVKAVNKGGTVQNFSINNMPSWLYVTPSKGNINPDSNKEIHFTVDEGLNIGNYNELIYLINDDNVSEALELNLSVVGKKPDWNVNPADFSYNMSIFGKMRFNNIYSDDKNDMLAAFKDGKCIGLANSAYDSDLDMWYTLLTIYGNEKQFGDIEFRMWDASSGKTYRATPSIEVSFVNDKIIGTPIDPVIFSETELIFRDISVVSGWNWVSLNLKNETLSNVNKTLENGTWVDGDFIKSLDYTDNYSVKNKTWDGELTRNGGLNNSSMYMIKSTNNQTFSVSGVEINPVVTPITVAKNSWHWLGYIPSGNMTVNEALSDYAANQGDVIKSQTSFAMFFGNKWVGNLSYMEANKGYMIHNTGNANITFSYPKSSSTKLKSLRIKDNFSVNYAQYPNNMNLIVTSNNLLPTDKIVVEVDNEVRGEDVSVIIDGKENIRFITINSDKENSYLTFKRESGGETTTYSPLIKYNSNTVLGTISSPIVLDFEERTKNIDVFPNPFNRELNIIVSTEENSEIIIKLLDASGHIIYDINQNSVDGLFQKTLNTSALDKGIYLIQIIENGKQTIKKVVKK